MKSVAIVSTIAAAALFHLGCGLFSYERPRLAFVETVAGIGGEIGEPFGVAVKDGFVYVSDGQNGNILRIAGGGKLEIFATGLDTPSGIAFADDGTLIVADAGSHTIKSVDPKGTVATIAGVDASSGNGDGDASAAIFNAPVGVAVAGDGRIFVADTYNDRIRMIDGGKVSTLAGSETGFADGLGAAAKFHTPTGIALWQDKLLVADTGNRRIRVVEPDGRVWTLAGDGNADLTDGLLTGATFVQPTAVAVDDDGSIFVADGNAIRQIGGGVIPTVRTISNAERGLDDGASHLAGFNRPSGVAIDSDGRLIVADSENRLVRRFVANRNGREITSAEIAGLRESPEVFRSEQPARWPFDPPNAKRDIAGTLGEIRGEMRPDNDEVWFHNGLDIAGSYGETARFVRDEKVLRPVAAENFETLREFIRMPTLGYIHLRLGRDVAGVPFGDGRFQFRRDPSGKLTGVRVPRGTKFKAGDAIGTLNSMNHVHLIAGRSGSEINAIAALDLPGLNDSRPPSIEKVTLFDENWMEIETATANSRIRLSGKTRLVVRAFDQTDGNPKRRRLGVYRVGYQIFKANSAPLSELKWTISFDRLSPASAVRLVYADGSRSGATGETVFSYIATNYVDGDEYHEGFIDAAELDPGIYTLRASAADYFGNITSRDITFEVEK